MARVRPSTHPRLISKLSDSGGAVVGSTSSCVFVYVMRQMQRRRDTNVLEILVMSDRYKL